MVQVLDPKTALTLDPVAADWAEEIGVQTVGFFDLVQEFSDIHYLHRNQGVKNIIDMFHSTYILSSTSFILWIYYQKALCQEINKKAMKHSVKTTVRWQ